MTTNGNSSRGGAATTAADATILVTDRLRIRRFTPTDTDAFAAYRSHPGVARYQSWSTPYRRADATALIDAMQTLDPGTPGAWYQLAVERRSHPGPAVVPDALHRRSAVSARIPAGDQLAPAADCATAQLVGDLACRVDDDGAQMEVGLTIAPPHQGNGYAAEALRALLTHAFDAWRLHRVYAVTDARNLRGAALLARVGMRQEGHFVDNVFFKGAWGSELLFARLAREHQPAEQPAAPPAAEAVAEAVAQPAVTARGASFDGR